MTTAHINIGSNLGHRAALIHRAVCLVGKRVGRVIAESAPVESAPWGFNSPNRFMNVGINVETSLPSADLVAALLEIERDIAPGASHRTPSGEYADRAIDLDLICMGNEMSALAEATVPHPLMHLREFVLVPLAEILPDWRHPQSQLTAAEMLHALHNKTAPLYVKKE